ncbi:hypothetical protein BJ508DRAFT_332382 [Ascobolus immersus RN42]|uniref:Uncharacterized protein n=1 Tax=Ascobolus immersus RN42 TaxID=1160509 RepID=A0A3N4HN64_ASCIM|nr:hypothetical protein BJ508DRAFT_332382 [Ascobolus immersus RN42]
MKSVLFFALLPLFLSLELITAAPTSTAADVLEPLEDGKVADFSNMLKHILKHRPKRSFDDDDDKHADLSIILKYLQKHRPKRSFDDDDEKDADLSIIFKYLQKHRPKREEHVPEPVWLMPPPTDITQLWPKHPQAAPTEPHKEQEE